MVDVRISLNELFTTATNLTLTCLLLNNVKINYQDNIYFHQFLKIEPNHLQKHFFFCLIIAGIAGNTNFLLFHKIKKAFLQNNRV